MTNAHLTIRVPEQNQEFDILVDGISRYYGQVEGFEEIDDPEALRAVLLEQRGQLIDIAFEDVSDNPVLEIGLALVARNSPAPFFGYWDSGSEPSRGERFLGGYLVRLEGAAEPVMKSFPWQNGAPGPDDRSLRSAGFSDNEVAAIGREFFSQPSAPTP